MPREALTTSVLVRVVTGGVRGRRIVLYDLRSRTVLEFATWEEAFEHMRALSERSGLR